MGKRDLAKREGTHSCRSSNMNSQIYLHVEIYTLAHIKTDQWRTSIHTDTNMFIHMHSCVLRYTQTKHASTNMNTHTHTDMYSFMFTNVYTLTEKPIVQHTDLCSHRHRPDMDTHKYICAHPGRHRYI